MYTMSNNNAARVISFATCPRIMLPRFHPTTMNVAVIMGFTAFPTMVLLLIYIIFNNNVARTFGVATCPKITLLESLV